MQAQRYRVIQWGTGQTGVHALRSIIAHPDLELVGVWVHSEEKDGKDAGQLCGIEPVGVRATTDIDSLLSLSADCVCYMAPDFGRDITAVVNDVARILGSGKNVVATQTALGWPLGMGDDLVAQLTDACQSGGTSLYTTGLQPDGNQGLATALASMSQVQSISISEIYDLGQYREPV